MNTPKSTRLLLPIIGAVVLLSGIIYTLCTNLQFGIMVILSSSIFFLIPFNYTKLLNIAGWYLSLIAFFCFLVIVVAQPGIAPIHLTGFILCGIAIIIHFGAVFLSKGYWKAFPSTGTILTLALFIKCFNSMSS